MKKIIALFVAFVISVSSIPAIFASASEIVRNRVEFSFAETQDYFELRTKMNCYGYAIQVYSLENAPNQNYYKQQPGEFAVDSVTFATMMNLYGLCFAYDSANQILDFIESKIVADFNSLNSYDSNEWTIQSTTANANVPTGYRKIALTIKSGNDGDFHFYARHSDGTWSHKRGTGSFTNKSIDTNVTITDANITSVVSEGGYDDGVRYYLIKKSAVVDFPHYNGQNQFSDYTNLAFSDRAGDTLSKSAQLISNTGRFDYSSDVDCYYLYVTSSGNYHFTATAGLTTSDMDMQIFDSNGNSIASDFGTGNPSIWVQLSAGRYYYIKVYDYNENVMTYSISYTH